jgi:hypothetical protein
MPVLLKPMTGRRYYITTLADWHRHAHRFANSHWLALAAPHADDADRGADDSNVSTVGARHAVPEHADGEAAPSSRELMHATRTVPDAQPPGVSAAPHAQPSAATRIIVLVDADEGVHLALDDDAAFEALPHPFAPKAISHAAHEALAAHGVAPGSTTFDAAEAIARAHPLLRPSVF